MKTPLEDFKRWFIKEHHNNGTPTPNKIISKIDELLPKERQDYAEAYHKAKVGSIADKDIYKQSIHNQNSCIKTEKGFVKGAKWLKQKLLEQ